MTPELDEAPLPQHSDDGASSRDLTYSALKRAFDIAASATGLLLAAPVLAAAAAAVKLTSTGPALFSQARVGRCGRPFHILKLRSMRVNSSGPAITARSDSRITRVGAVLRRTKLDELPQLWNVLVGDMSLVGPRPEAQRYVELFPEDYRRILRVRPGITDYAAIEYRDEEAILSGAPDIEAAYVETVLPAKIRLYHRYLDEMSLKTDLALLLGTLRVLLRRR